MCVLETKYLLHGNMMDVMDLEVSWMGLTGGMSNPKVILYILPCIQLFVHNMEEC